MSKRRPARRPECRTPLKVAFQDAESANFRIEQINSTVTHNTKTPQRSYQCSCGSWHLTSKA